MAARPERDPQQVALLARQALDRIGASTDAAEAVRRELADAPAADVRQGILELCVAAPDRVTVAVVAAALHSGEAALARMAAEMIGQVHDAPAALAMLRDCFALPDPAVRCRAVEGLESFSDPAIADVLAQALTDESDSVRRAATTTLSLIVGTAYHPLRDALLGQLEDPGAPLSQAIARNGDDQIRRQAVQSLGFVRSDRVLPTLERMTLDDDPEVRQEVALCLAAVGTDSAVALMARMLEDPTYTVASSVLDMLAARLGGASTALLEHLGKALHHPLAEVRRHAVLMLDSYDVERVGQLLTDATRDEDFEVARRAGEMLRKGRPGANLDWLAGEMGRQTAGERALTVWEAGNIGLEADVAFRAGGGQTAELVPMLERALKEGSASDKMHAVGELGAMVDIADSSPMREALNDPDPGVRSRAGDTLQHTRDAAFLAQVGRSHPDALVRRVAAEALSANPGGPRRSGRSRRDIAFASTRTVAPELYGFFLDALRDPDDGVRLRACESIREYARLGGLVPVRRTLDALATITEDPNASYLMQEDAAHAGDDVRKLPLAEMLKGRAEAVLAWRGALARQAHALRWEEASGQYALRGTIGEEAVQHWAAVYGLAADQAAAARAAIASSGSLDAETGRRVLGGLTRDMSACLLAVAHAAAALRLLGQEGHEGTLEQWASAAAAGPRLDWGPTRVAEPLTRRLHRARRRAWIAATVARESLAGSPRAEALAEALGDEDDWVRLTALRGVWDTGTAPDSGVGQMRDLGRRHLGDDDYCEPVGLAAVALMEAGDDAALELAEFGLGTSQVDLRVELTNKLLAAAQREPAAESVGEHLTGRAVAGLPALCLALALRGAGWDLAGLHIAEPDRAGTDEEACARLALRAMDNDEEAAAALAETLRRGQPRQRYCAAHYLALARVRSAALIFSSVRDQVEAPYVLRVLCAASLLRRGHPSGLVALNKLGEGAVGRIEAELLTHVCRAIEDTIPVMLQCRDVNVGRFV